MDSIFETDADEVGGEIEAYCPSPRCKADTTHTIISMYEDEVRRVQCVVCGEVHAYRKPRGDAAEGEGDGTGKRTAKRLTWDDAMSRASDNDLNNCRPFSILDSFEEGDVVHHPTFDIGFVTELLPDNKVEVMFRDNQPRILVHNRRDLAARMPEISEIPAPREAKKKKRAKKPEVAATPVPARSKAEVEAAVGRARAAAQARMDEAAKSADERNKKMKADAKKTKGGKPAAPAPAKVAAKPVAAAKPAPAKAAAKPVAKPAAKPVAKPAAKQAAAKPAKKPAKPAKKPAKPAKKPAAKPAKKPAKKKK
jgi:hypothetical protein